MRDLVDLLGERWIADGDVDVYYRRVDRQLSVMLNTATGWIVCDSGVPHIGYCSTNMYFATAREAMDWVDEQLGGAS